MVKVINSVYLILTIAQKEFINTTFNLKVYDICRITNKKDKINSGSVYQIVNYRKNLSI